MNIDSGLFLYFIIISSFFALMMRPAARNTYLIPVVNVIYFILLAHPLKMIWPVAGFVAVGYGFYRARLAFFKGGWIPAVALIFLVGLFVYLKQYTFLAAFSFKQHVFFTVGLSYTLFRIIHLIVDGAESGASYPKNFMAYFTYIGFFPAYSSGPVQLYPAFAQALAEQKTVDANAATAAISRIILGYLKCVVMAKLIFTLQQSFFTTTISGGEGVHIVAGSFAAVLYLFYLYTNFSGYIDVAIGVGGLFGIAMPENFYKAFSARSFLDLWSVWHITMSNWFKLYVFNPLVKALTHLAPKPQYAQWFGVIGYFVTFFVMGLWHGTTFMFSIYGLLLGLGAGLNKLYQNYLRKWLHKTTITKLKNNFWYRAVCRSLTYTYFSFGLICFWMSGDDFTKFFAGIGKLPGLVGAFSIGAVFLLVLFEGCEYFNSVIKAFFVRRSAAAMQ